MRGKQGGGRLSRLLRICAVFALSLSAVVFTGPAPASASAPVPTQFIAKLYTEALGRAPDPSGWNWHLQYFGAAGCSQASLAQEVRAFYTGGEFAGLGYDNTSRVLALYRGALNRDADQFGLNDFASRLNAGSLSWAGLIEIIVASGEFASLKTVICGPSPSYFYGTTPAPDLPTIGTGYNPRTGAALQAILNAQPPGAVVELAQRAVVRITQPLMIPPGVTLVTTGMPNPARYVLQARLVREGPVGADTFVQLKAGARLLHVWVDGHRGNPRNHVRTAFNIMMLGGTGTEVSQSKVSETAGATSINALAWTPENGECLSNIISYNVVTSYSAAGHDTLPGEGRWADGITVECGDATVVHNSIVDASDVALILFRAKPYNQRSQLLYNQILSAGNSAFSALAATGENEPGPPGVHPFYGAQVSGNTLWTGPNTHFQIALEIGTRPHFGVNLHPGIGATFAGNATPAGTYAIVSTGIAISGMYQATVQANSLALIARPVSACPLVAIGYDIDGFAAGSNIQPGGVAVSFLRPGTAAGCIG